MRSHKGVIRSLFILTSHADGYHRPAAHREHRRYGHGKGNEGNANVHRPNAAEPTPWPTKIPSTIL